MSELQTFDDLLLKLIIVFVARRIEGVTPFRAAEAAKQEPGTQVPVLAILCAAYS